MMTNYFIAAYLLGIILSYILIRYIQRKDEEEVYDWTSVGAGLIVSIVWPIAIILVIVGVIIELLKKLRRYFNSTRPPRWL